MITWAPLLATLIVGVVCQQSTTPATANSPAGQPNTRFLPGLGLPGLGNIASLFDPCSNCGNSQAEGQRCCQRGSRQCCRAFGPALGGFGGQFGQGGFGQGQFGQGQFGQGQFGQSQFGQGQFGQGGFGQSQFGGQFGQNQFGPPGFAGGNNFLGGQPQVKPGFCPRTGLNALLLGRSGASADTTTAGQPGVETFLEGGARNGNDRRGSRQQQRQQERQNSRQKRQSRDDVRNDRRNRRLNRLSRVNGRVTRQTQGTNSQTGNTQANGSPNTRFFGLPNVLGIKNPFCDHECFNDFDCFGSLKCCLDQGECRKCSDPRPF